jgi:hypothetical protein
MISMLSVSSRGDIRCSVGAQNHGAKVDRHIWTQRECGGCTDHAGGACSRLAAASPAGNAKQETGHLDRWFRHSGHY